jgi:hypothetical protein
MVTPPFVRTGYAEIVFVSVNHTRPWTVPVTPVAPIMIEEPIEAMDASSTVDPNLTVPDAVGALPEPETFTQMDMEMASPASGPTSASAPPPPPPLTRVFPRRWLDIWGGRIQPVWNAACHAVLGTVLLHPGITQVSPFPPSCRRNPSSAPIPPRSPLNRLSIFIFWVRQRVIRAVYSGLTDRSLRMLILTCFFFYPYRNCIALATFTELNCNFDFDNNYRKYDRTRLCKCVTYAAAINRKKCCGGYTMFMIDRRSKS